MYLALPSGLRNQRRRRSALCKVHWRSVHHTAASIVVFQRHVLGKDSSDLVSHVLSCFLVLVGTQRRKSSNHRQHAEGKETRRDATSFTFAAGSFAVSLFHAPDGVYAASAELTGFGSGAVQVAGANGCKDIVDVEGTADGRRVDKGGRDDNDAPLFLSTEFGLEFVVGLVVHRAAGIHHTTLDLGTVNLGILVNVLDTSISGKVIRVTATYFKLRDVIPPFLSDSVRLFRTYSKHRDAGAIP